MKGYDIPIYTNIVYPFPKNPPFIGGDYFSEKKKTISGNPKISFEKTGCMKI